MKTLRGVVSWLGAIVLGVCAQAAATRTSGGTLYVNEAEVLTLRSGKASSREERIRWVAERVRALGQSSAISVKTARSSVQIVSGDYVVLNVLKAEARAHGTSPVALGEAWASSLRKALAIGPIEPETTSVKLPPGGALTVALKGSALAKMQIAVADPNLVAAKRTSAGLRLDAKAVGVSDVVLSAGDESVRVRVSVAPYAAAFPQSCSVTVTGDPASADMIRGAIEGALRTQLKLQPGTEIAYSLPEVRSMPFEDSQTLAVRVKADGPDLFPAEGIVNIGVRNLPIGYRAETELWYCNDPENVRRPGPLFTGELHVMNPVRLLYHHINESNSGLYLHVEMVNRSSKPARVLIIPGDSKPDKNPVLAGIQAADVFVRSWVRYSGEVVTVPPQSIVPIAMRRLSPKETMSGLAYLRLLDGPSSLEVRAEAHAPYEVGSNVAAALQSPTPWRVVASFPVSGSSRANLSEHIYPLPFRTEEITYEVGGKHGFVRIGQRPIERADKLSYLSGNFGVFYTIDARLQNPTNEAVTVEAVFEASAGYSGAIFVVNGEVKRTRLLQPKEEAQVLVTRVAPNAFQQVRIQTVPLSGSSYPATITFRALDYGGRSK